MEEEHQGHDEQNQAGHDDDDHDEDHHDRQYARDAQGHEAGDRRLDEECDGRPEDESAEEVPQEVEHHESNDQGPEAEGNLEIAPTPLRIER